MVKHYTRPALISAVSDIIAGGPYRAKSRGDGRAGVLLEELLGISGGNLDVADAVGIELKTTMNPNTPLTLFHKDPKPRGKDSAMKQLVARYGWPSEHHGAPVTSFRATVWGRWEDARTGRILRISADNDRVVLTENGQERAHWDSNDLFASASAKLRNMMFVEAKVADGGMISYVSAQLFESFQPFKFLKAIDEGLVAIDFDARTKPGSESLRNHGTKFRIRERDIIKLFGSVTPLK